MDTRFLRTIEEEVVLNLKGMIILGLFLALLIPQSSRAQSKDWTVMVFMNADNNLSSYGVEDLEEATEAGSSEHANIVFQVDLAHGEPCRRYYIEQGEALLLEDLGEIDMGQMSSVIDFVQMCKEDYPAEKYLLIMWNHGSGWRRTRNNPDIRGISFDEESGNYINTLELAEGMREIKTILGKKLDILAFDACLMQMVEVAWAVKDTADLMIASEQTEPVGGYYYKDAFEILGRESSPSAKEFADHIVREYCKAYNDGAQGDKSTTQSWVDLRKIAPLKSAIDDLSQKAFGKYSDELFNIQFKVSKFYYPENKDLIHFMKLIQEFVPDEEIKEAAASVENAADDFVGLAMTSKGSGMLAPDYSETYGTAIYFPSRDYSFKEQYLKLGFSKASKWDEFMREYHRIMEENQQ